MAITVAKVVSIASETDKINIEIPTDFLESTMAGKEESGKNNYAVIIFTPSTKIIKIYPTKSDTVARIEVSIGELTPDFLQEVSAVFLEFGIKTLYSTGVCFTSESCLYEVYIDKNDFPEDVNLQARLGEIRGVAEVKLDMLTPAS